MSEPAFGYDLPGQLLRCHRLGASLRASNIAPQRAMRVGRDLLADSFDVVTQVENPDRRVNVIKVNGELPQRCTGVVELSL
jgi:hypothetical protein